MLRTGMVTRLPQQLIAPLVCRLRCIKPVFFEERMDLSLDDAAIPGFRIIHHAGRREEAVPNPKAGAEVRAICLDGLVQFAHTVDDPVDDILWDATCFEVRAELGRSVKRLHCDEGKASAKRVIDKRL